MPRFRYDALDANDQPLQGEVEAPGVAAAAVQLEELGIAVRSISQVLESAPPSETATDATARHEPAPPELVEAMRRLLDRREALLAPLTAYAKEAPGRERRGELRSVLVTLQRGDLDEAIASATRNPRPWAPLLAAATGGEESVLTRLTQASTATTSTQRQRWATIAYPLFVLTILLLVLWPLASGVVPIFRQIFRGFGLELPRMTALVLEVAYFLSSGGAFLLIGFAVAAAATYVTWPRWCGIVDSGWLGYLAPRPTIPIGTAADRTRVAADLLQSGLNSEDSLRLAGLGTVSRPAIEQVSGEALAETKLPAVFEALSGCYAEQSRRQSASLGTVTIVLVGMAVGLVVISLFLPLVSLIENLT